ncbi:MAG: MBL fold metallo-hydrolase, partial [Kangiellaceae bacterium]|nr:MBL fold metallo-hydrolase [Kangiellaceae bacterium]
MKVKTFFDKQTFTFTYVIIDETTEKCAVIDSVLDFDIHSGTTKYDSANKVVDFITDNNLKNEWILETRVHADHITAAHYLKEKIGGQIAIGSGIKDVLSFWVPKFENEKDTPVDGSQFDVLFNEGDEFCIGNLNVVVWHTPGHTPACASFLIDNSIFVGDTVFSPNLGTARCDFPGGSATKLYESIKRFYTLPDATTIYLGHDYPEEGQEPIYAVTVGESKEANKMLNGNTALEEFLLKRQTLDKSLAVPKLLFPSIQSNMRNGQFGSPTARGQKFI